MPQPLSIQSARARDWAYANGNLGKSALSSMMDVFALFYLTTVLDVSAEVAGVVILVSMIWDALTDPLIGYWADHSRERRQTATSYFLFGVPVTASAFLLFYYAQFVPPGFDILAAVAALLVFRAGYALIDVPHNGLLTRLAGSAQTRTDISGMRIFFSALGKLCVTGMAAWLLDNPGNAESDAAFTWIALAMTLVFAISLLICGFAVRDVKLHLEGGSGPPKLKEIIQSFRETRALRTMFLLTAINSLMTPGVAVAMIYAARYELGNAALGAQAVLVQALAQAASLLLWSAAVRKFGGRTRILTAAYGLLAIVALLGTFGLASYWRMLMVAFGSGFATGGIFMLNWALLPDALEEARRHSSSRALLSYFGLYTIINKTLHGLAQASLGLVLGAVGFTAALGFPEGEAGTFQAAVFALPALGSMICIVVLIRLRSERTAAPGQK